MNTDKLNQWVSLIANVGVLVGLVVLIFELQQTQNSLAATGHSARTDRNMTIGMFGSEQGINDLRYKYAQGEELTRSELEKLSSFNRMVLRHFEDMHYQRQLGIIDDETWEANLIGIRNIVNQPSFEETVDFDVYGMRRSFIDLAESLIEEN